jgi:TonB-dependent receptor
MNILFNEQASDVTDFQTSDNWEDRLPSNNQQAQYTTLQYGERQLAYLQVSGEHVIKPLRRTKIDWVGSLGQSKLNEPDQRLFQSFYLTNSGVYTPFGETGTDDPTFTQSASPLQRYSRDLSENSYNAIVNFSVPYFDDPSQIANPSKFKTGFYIDNSQRAYNQSLFEYKYGGAGDPPKYATFGGPGDPTGGQTWGDVYLDQNRSGLVNPTGALGNEKPLSWSLLNSTQDEGSFYNASQQVIASYLMTEFQLFPQLTLTGGARFENTNIKIIGAENLPPALFPGFTGLAKIQQLDLLPAVSANFQLMQDVNLRFAWSQTLARPSFKEMGPVVTQDFSDATIFVGNPSLKLSSVNNYDFRAEYFPRAGEVLATSLFYKDLKRPIEQVIFNSVGTQFFKYENNPEAQIWGLEVEARKRLDQLNPVLKNFSINFNFTYIQSQVTLTQQQTSEREIRGFPSTRPLQGQPLYIINSGLSYDDQELGFYAGLFYNVTGPLLYAAGQGLPDIYEQPAPTLDFNLTQNLADQWKLTFRGKNLLNPIVRQTITYAGTEYDFLSYTKGFDLSLSVSYGF